MAILNEKWRHVLILFKHREMEKNARIFPNHPQHFSAVETTQGQKSKTETTLNAKRVGSEISVIKMFPYFITIHLVACSTSRFHFDVQFSQLSSCCVDDKDSI